MTTRRDAIARQTSAWLFTLSEDENRVIAEIVSRVRKAVPQYGHVDIRTDKRDFRQERAEEIFDATFYAGLEWLKRHVARVDAVTAPDAASVEERPGQGSLLSRGVRTEEGRPASDARGLALSAPADTVVPHDGERTHGGNFRDGEKLGSGQPKPHIAQQRGGYAQPRNPLAAGNVANPQSSPTAHRSGHSPSHLSAAGRHGAAAPGVSDDFDLSDIGGES